MLRTDRQKQCGRVICSLVDPVPEQSNAPTIIDSRPPSSKLQPLESSTTTDAISSWILMIFGNGNGSNGTKRQGVTWCSSYHCADHIYLGSDCTKDPMDHDGILTKNPSPSSGIRSSGIRRQTIKLEAWI
jgi:hypothetical protein